MTRSLRFHSSSVLIATLICLSIAYLASSPASTAQGSPFALPSASDWPPHPKRIVNIATDVDFTSVAANTPIPVFDVPRNRWLVITNMEIQLKNVGNGAFFPNRSTTVAQSLGGTSTVKLPAGTIGTWIFAGGGNETGPYSSPVGLKFMPGSQVTVANAFTSFAGTVTATGYLVDL